MASFSNSTLLLLKMVIFWMFSELKVQLPKQELQSSSSNMALSTQLTAGSWTTQKWHQPSKQPELAMMSGWETKEEQSTAWIIKPWAILVRNTGPSHSRRWDSMMHHHRLNWLWRSLETRKWRMLATLKAHHRCSMLCKLTHHIGVQRSISSLLQLLLPDWTTQPILWSSWWPRFKISSEIPSSSSMCIPSLEMLFHRLVSILYVELFHKYANSSKVSPSHMIQSLMTPIDSKYTWAISQVLLLSKVCCTMLKAQETISLLFISILLRKKTLLNTAKRIHLSSSSTKSKYQQPCSSVMLMTWVIPKIADGQEIPLEVEATLSSIMKKSMADTLASSLARIWPISIEQWSLLVITTQSEIMTWILKIDQI